MTIVRGLRAGELDSSEPIFESFRADYPGFDEWLGKCAREARIAWVVDRSPAAGGFRAGGARRRPTAARYGGVCIVHRQDSNDYGWEGSAFKICSFKILPEEERQGWGGQLLRKALEAAKRSGVAWVFAEVFPKYEALVELFGRYDFELAARSKRGELVLRRDQRPGGRRR